MLIVGFGIIGFCDIITLFRPIYAHNKHIMGQFLEYHQKSVGGNSHLAPSCGRILVAECSESETQTDEARWHVERMVEVGLHLLLQSFFWAIFAIFWTEIAIFEPKSTENRSLFEWQRQKLEFTGLKGYADCSRAPPFDRENFLFKN